MAKGIIYNTTTSVTGLIKIGKTGLDNFETRMRNLEQNGYWNVNGLHRYFAVEVEDYDEKESLLDTIFSKSRVANSELFAIDKDLAKEVLESFGGKQVYPKPDNKQKKYERESTSLPKMKWLIEQGILHVGDEVYLIGYPEKIAIVIDKDNVEYNGEKMSFNQFGCKLTGWKSIQIYKYMKIVGNDETLDALRYKRMQELGEI